MLIWAIGGLNFTGWGQGKFSGMWCEPIAELVWIPLHCVHKNTPGAPKRCSCSVQTQKGIKEFSKWKKTPSDLDETQSKKQKLSLPTVLLQDKSFCSAAPNSSPLAEPHEGSLPIPAELWQVFSSSGNSSSARAMEFLGACPARQLPYCGEGQSFVPLLGCP